MTEPMQCGVVLYPLVLRLHLARLPMQLFALIRITSRGAWSLNHPVLRIFSQT